MNNYFIVHGSFGSPFSNWFPWLFEEIEKMKPENQEEPICYAPQFPTGVNFQNYDNWQKVLDSYVKADILNENSTIFAHSIAPAFVCKFLIRNNIKVKRLIFVCGFNDYFGVSPEYDEVNKTMFATGLEKIKDLCNDIICVYSDNDPYVKFDAEKEFADKVSHKQIIIKNGGHLNKGSGYTEFPLLKDFI